MRTAKTQDRLRQRSLAWVYAVRTYSAPVNVKLTRNKHPDKTMDAQAGEVPIQIQDHTDQPLYLNSFNFSLKVFAPQRKKTRVRTWAPSGFRSACAFAVWSESSLGSFSIAKAALSSCEQRRLWSDRADALADLSLRLAHMAEGTFSHVEAHLSKSKSAFLW